MVCECNWGNVAQKLVIASERETLRSLLSAMESRQHMDELPKKAWAWMQEELVAAGPPVPEHAVTALPGPRELALNMSRNTAFLFLWIFQYGVFYRALHLSSFQTDTAAGKNTSLLGMPLGTSAESCGNYELFLLLAASKDHAADDVGIFFFPPLFSIICSCCRYLRAAFLLPKCAACPWSICRPDLSLLREVLPC